MGSAGVDVASNGVAGLIEDTIGDTPYAQEGEVKDTPASGARGPSLHWLKSKPAGALRFAFRLPIYLYRLDLGWLLGHRGHKSGLLRETLLEMILYNPATGESIVLSAWGEKADWCRNMEVTPALEARTASERCVPEQRLLVPEENHAVLAGYRRRHPLAFRVFVKASGFGHPLKGFGG
jgi:deazaflavin-dependent oxidoreductase (nitroreductase family)